MSRDSRYIDLSGPEGNVNRVAGLAHAWNRQLGRKLGPITTETTKRLGRVGDYNDVLDTFDAWFEHIEYEFLNDPRSNDIYDDHEDA